MSNILDDLLETVPDTEPEAPPKTETPHQDAHGNTYRGTKIPIFAKQALVRVYTKGYEKYQDAWMEIIAEPGGIGHFLDHALKHIDDHIIGRLFDEDGELNLTHAVADLMFCIDIMEELRLKAAEKAENENGTTGSDERSEDGSPEAKGTLGWWRRERQDDGDQNPQG